MIWPFCGSGRDGEFWDDSGLSVSVLLILSCAGESGAAIWAKSGFSGSGCDGGGAGGWEKGDAGSIEMACGSSLGWFCCIELLGGDLGGSSPGSRLSSVLK